MVQKTRKRGIVMLYLDHAATTATHPEVIKEMLPFFQDVYSNPSGSYEFAADSRLMLERARKVIADSIHAKPEEIFFTGSGTEADNWALVGMARLKKEQGKHIITSTIEHHAILRTCQYLEKKGYEITYLPVDHDGCVSVEDVERNIRPDTILISIMYANNEIGTLQPVERIGELARKKHIVFHTDAVQAYLHEPIDVVKQSIDLLSVSAHKFQGPKGTGFLYVKENIALPSLLHGGNQERKRRAGTENVAGIVGMAKAVSIGMHNLSENHEKLLSLRNYLIDRILKEIPYVVLNGSLENRLDANVSFGFRGIESQSLILFLDMEGICVSGGSACTSSEKSISHVLQAIGLPEEYARGTIRISLGVENTLEEMTYFVETLKELVAQLREFS